MTFQITFLCCFILTLVAILFDPIMCQSFMILLGFIVTVTVVSTISDSLMFCLFVNFYLLFGCCLAVTLIAHMNLSMLQPLVTSQCTSYFGRKKMTGLAGGVREGQGRSKYCPEWASLLALEPSRDPLNGSRTPEMDSNQSGAVGGIIWGPFKGSLTYLGFSRGL